MNEWQTAWSYWLTMADCLVILVDHGRLPGHTGWPWQTAWSYWLTMADCLVILVDQS